MVYADPLKLKSQFQYVTSRNLKIISLDSTVYAALMQKWCICLKISEQAAAEAGFNMCSPWDLKSI